MRYRLIAADVDGTLLNDRKEVTAGTEAAIRRAQANGAQFTIASGRPIQGLEPFLYLVSGDVPLVTYNGAVVLTAQSRRVLLRRELEAEPALFILREGLRRGLTVVVWSREQLYVGNPAGVSDEYAEKSRMSPQPLEHGEALAERGITKLIWIGEPTEIRRLAGELSAAAKGYTACTSEANYLEFMAPGVSKGEGLAAAAQALGIPREAVLALGDERNDIPMLRWAGLGVAMGNAPTDVQPEADIVTGTNEEDGLAQALDRYCAS